MSTEHVDLEPTTAEGTKYEHYDTYDRIRHGFADHFCNCCHSLLSIEAPSDWASSESRFSKEVTDYHGDNPETEPRLFPGAQEPTGERVGSRTRRVRTATDAISECPDPATARFWIDPNVVRGRVTIRCARCGYPAAVRNLFVGSDSALRADDISELEEELYSWYEHVDVGPVCFATCSARCFADACFWLRKVHGSDEIPWFSVFTFVKSVSRHFKDGRGTKINHALRDGFGEALAADEDWPVWNGPHQYILKPADPRDVSAETIAD